jgi:hypothetical protein
MVYVIARYRKLILKICFSEVVDRLIPTITSNQIYFKRSVIVEMLWILYDNKALVISLGNHLIKQ